MSSHRFRPQRGGWVQANEFHNHTEADARETEVASTTGESEEQAMARAYGKSEVGQVYNLTLASIHSLGTTASYNFANANSSASFSTSDITFTDTFGGPVSGARQTSINFYLSGRMLFYSLSGPGAFGVQATGNLVIDLTLWQGTTQISSGTLSITGTVSGSEPNIQWDSSASGIFSPYTPTSNTGELDAVITTGNFIFDPLLPLQVSTNLSTSAYAAGYFQVVVSQTTDFLANFWVGKRRRGL